MTFTDELLANAERYAAAFAGGDLPMHPAPRIAVVACMDARLFMGCWGCRRVRLT